jgi:hypothetical protein
LVDTYGLGLTEEIVLAVVYDPQRRCVFPALLVGRRRNVRVSVRELVGHLSQRDLLTNPRGRAKNVQVLQAPTADNSVDVTLQFRAKSSIL